MVNSAVQSHGSILSIITSIQSLDPQAGVGSGNAPEFVNQGKFKLLTCSICIFIIIDISYTDRIILAPFDHLNNEKTFEIVSCHACLSYSVPLGFVNFFYRYFFNSISESLY
ncbi:hypothetical protein Dimus_016494 [Dionaea muscipula]